MPNLFIGFPLEGYPFFFERQWGLYPWIDVLVWVVFLIAAVTLGSVVLASRIPPWQKLPYVPKTRAGRQALLVLTYVFFALSFGFFYHYLFQVNPRNFTITSTIDEVRQVDAILEHQQGLENLRDAEDVIAATVVGLRTEAGRRALS